ncbi:MAG TPA: hypothetical protein VES42_27635, partial [Pilimelia sp.]|nr:hypothetical protein [Pilimelia sp.]
MLGLGAVLVGVPTVISGVAERAGTLTAIEQVPRDNPGLGLVYDGLAPAKANTPCVGAYEVTDRQTCSHGPDQPPPGLNVKRAVAPVARTSPVPTLPRRDTGPVPAELEL